MVIKRTILNSKIFISRHEKQTDEVIPMTLTSRGCMQSEPNTAIRREAFKVFSDTLRKYQHSTASAYNTQIQKENNGNIAWIQIQCLTTY